MIKLLNVITSMDPVYGGMCQGIRNSIGDLNPVTTTNHVLCLDDPDSEYLGMDKFKVIPLGDKRTSWGYSKHLKKWLIKNLTTYDAVIVHGLWQYNGYAVRNAIETLKSQNKKTPKFYIMTHGMMDPYFQKAPDRKLKAIRNLFFWKFIEQKTVNSTDGLFFTCEEELLLARTTFSGYAPKKEINIGYGILPPPALNKNDIANFRKRNGLLPDEKYILFISRLHPKKGLINLVNAYSDCLNEHINLPKLVLAGPGLEEEFGKSIYNLVKENSNLKNNVLFIGMITGPEKWAAFYGAASFILPSHQENFGIAVVEALACHCPVLISNKVNIWREIQKGKAGIVSEDTQLATAESLKKFVSLSNIELQEMKNDAYIVYKENFTMTHASKQYLKAIENGAI
ncbi:glycosyltransferase [Maribacter stanieri]|uniref:glycosyltransferase n=1 Tax=Maribacter stanieri TaxID=440514 RepID=UPI002495A0D9|nr:glycosyltransferase [Maribacter stanieri]